MRRPERECNFVWLVTLLAIMISFNGLDSAFARTSRVLDERRSELYESQYAAEYERGVFPDKALEANGNLKIVLAAPEVTPVKKQQNSQETQSKGESIEVDSHQERMKRFELLRNSIAVNEVRKTQVITEEPIHDTDIVNSRLTGGHTAEILIDTVEEIEHKQLKPVYKPRKPYVNNSTYVSSTGVNLKKTKPPKKSFFETLFNKVTLTDDWYDESVEKIMRTSNASAEY